MTSAIRYKRMSDDVMTLTLATRAPGDTASATTRVQELDVVKNPPCLLAIAR